MADPRSHWQFRRACLAQHHRERHLHDCQFQRRNNGNRLGNSAIINLVGGTLNFTNDASANNFSETLGLLYLAGGDSTVNLSQAASGQTSILRLGGISASQVADGQLRRHGPGREHSERRHDHGPAHGFRCAWARSGVDWVKYAQIDSTGVYSVMAFASSDYTIGTSDSSWTGTGVFPKLSGGTTTLSATSRTISSLNLAPTSATTLNIPDGDTLHIDGGSNGSDVGGILVSGSTAATIAASGTNHTGADYRGPAESAGGTAH